MRLPAVVLALFGMTLASFDAMADHLFIVAAADNYCERDSARSQ